MLANVTADSVEARFDWIRSRKVGIDLGDTITLTQILLDDGTGYRPFYPLSLTIDHAEVILPCSIAAGERVMEFTGEEVDGTGLMFCGYGMQFVRSIEVKSVANRVPEWDEIFFDSIPPDNTNAGMIENLLS